MVVEERILTPIHVWITGLYDSKGGDVLTVAFFGAAFFIQAIWW